MKLQIRVIQQCIAMIDSLPLITYAHAPSCLIFMYMYAFSVPICVYMQYVCLYVHTKYTKSPVHKHIHVQLNMQFQLKVL